MFDIIEQIIAGHFHVTREELLADRRRNATDARHFLWYILHSVMGYSGDALAKRYNITERNVFFYSAIVRDGIKHQPFFTGHYRELQTVLRTMDII